MENRDTTTPHNWRRLSEGDYEVAPGEYDVRGWKVVLANNEQIGKVDDLIVDPAAQKVRYLDVELNRHALKLEHDRHVCIPIARAALDADDKTIVLTGLDRATVLTLPNFTGSPMDAEYDRRYGTLLKDEYASKRMTRSAEELRIDKRVARQGEVRVSKHVETERVRQEVPLRREEVHVERRPVERAAGSQPEFRDDEIVVPVMEEEAVIEKRPVVKEEIVISKEPVTETRTIETDVRHEEVDVDRAAGEVRAKRDHKPQGDR